jgi:pimeloyl-ACP methyl ester carboxylesterase
MKRIRRQVALLGLLSLVSRPAPAQPARSNPPETTEQFIDVDGRTMHLRVGGSGTPTVVLDSGLGDSLAPWNDIFPAIAGFTRVVAYDRAGYGRSDPGPEPRSYGAVATELHTLLTRAGFAPPYVLVGHSLGGAHIRAFAHLFKDDVAGLVFVDPISEEMFAAASSEERKKDREEQDAAVSKGPPGVRGEWAFSREESLHDFPQLRSLGTPPDVPMAVLVASRGRPRLWVRSLLSQYGRWIADASEGYLLVTADSGHYIQRDEPGLVISAIRRVVFPSAEKALARLVEEKGVLAAIATYRDMKARYPTDYLQERTLNRLGYERLQGGHVDDAIAIFKLNVEMYSDGFNTHDSLAEAYMVKGNRQAAIEHYRKSLALNPDNSNARLMLKKLEDGLPR